MERRFDIETAGKTLRERLRERVRKRRGGLRKDRQEEKGTACTDVTGLRRYWQRSEVAETSV